MRRARGFGPDYFERRSIVVRSWIGIEQPAGINGREANDDVHVIGQPGLSIDDRRQTPGDHVGDPAGVERLEQPGVDVRRRHRGTGGAPSPESRLPEGPGGAT